MKEYMNKKKEVMQATMIQWTRPLQPGSWPWSPGPRPLDPLDCPYGPAPVPDLEIFWEYAERRAEEQRQREEERKRRRRQAPTVPVPQSQRTQPTPSPSVATKPEPKEAPQEPERKSGFGLVEID